MSINRTKSRPSQKLSKEIVTNLKQQKSFKKNQEQLKITQEELTPIVAIQTQISLECHQKPEFTPKRLKNDTKFDQKNDKHLPIKRYCSEQASVKHGKDSKTKNNVAIQHNKDKKKVNCSNVQRDKILKMIEELLEQGKNMKKNTILKTNETNQESPKQYNLHINHLSVNDYGYSRRNDIYSPNQMSLATTSSQKSNLQNEITLKQFDIVRKVGKGKFGSVFLAVHKQSKLIVALKAINKNSVEQANKFEQLIRQITIQSYINHPHVVQLYGIFHTKQKVYLIMEYCQGGQLYQMLKKNKKITEESTSHLIRQIANGIQHLHDHGIIHRDIKPENIVMANGCPKLCDLGFSVNAKGQKRDTMCGTPIYVSPELLLGSLYDNKVDIWALGILTYEMLTGTVPFEIYKDEHLKKIISSDIRYPKTMNKVAVSFIKSILKKNPQKRTTIKDLLQHQFIRKWKINSTVKR